MRIAVLGAGAWGTAIAIHLAQRHEVTLWARDAGLCEAMRAGGSNERYLPRQALPPELRITSDLPVALSAQLVLIAVPTGALRETLQRMEAGRWRGGIVWLCKGFEPRTGKLPHQVCEEVRGSELPHGVLSGPSFAEEVARGLPTAVTVAAADVAFASETARALHGGSLRVYCGDDVVGVEVAGALKNVMAIAAGICDGLALGLNARAALITRGLAEMMRLGTRMGGRAETFMGLAGLGDLILTCTGDLSRNRRVGLRLGGGEPLAAILSDLGHVAEGVNTAREVDRLAASLGVDMPITRAVCRVLDDHAAGRAVVQELLQREPKFEYGP
jgi:glycerol-3-phosphate dehydrogenase (NAD(P)+)